MENDDYPPLTPTQLWAARILSLAGLGVLVILVRKVLGMFPDLSGFD